MTDTQPPPTTDPVIHISVREANGAHVDDLLRRQANMRGETGMTRDRRSPWYLRSWLVLMLAGGFAAFCSWAIIEPNFDDSAYDQGSIENFVTSEVLTTPEATNVGTHGVDQADPSTVYGTIVVHGQPILVGNFTRDVNTHLPIILTKFKIGNEAGVHAQIMPNAEEPKKLGSKATSNEPTWMALFIDLTPPPAQANLPNLAQSSRRSQTTGMVIFALTAALIGLFIGAADGIICRLWARAAISGLVGLGIGFLGGFIASILANFVYSPLTEIAQAHMNNDGTGGFTGFGLMMQMIARTLAWGLAGVAMGLGQGIALRSWRLLLFGLLGGVVGGLLGGIVFDPIDLILLGPDKPSAHLSRMIGFVVIGCSVGAMIGIVELLARDAWLRMDEGPLAGKEFLVFKDVMKIGSSPRSDIYLFNDPQVEPHHATLRAIGEEVEIESQNQSRQAQVNERRIKRARLRHGDRITIGRAVFTYRRRGG